MQPASLLAALLLTLSATAAAAENDADSAYRAGSEALRAGDHAAASAQFERAVELDPGRVEGWFKLGLARNGLAEPEAAIQAYRRAVELDPTHARALNNLANIYFRQGDYGTAESWYAKALEVDPDYLLALYHQGWVLRHFNRGAEAERVLRRCREPSPQNNRERVTQFDCAFVLGTLRFRDGDWGETASLMQHVLSEVPSHLEARFSLAMSYRRLGRNDEARQQLEMHRKMLQSRRATDPIARQHD